MMWLGHSSSGPEKKRFRDRVPSQLALRDDDSAEIKTKILRIENVRTKLSKTSNDAQRTLAKTDSRLGGIQHSNLDKCLK